MYKITKIGILYTSYKKKNIQNPKIFGILYFGIL